MYKARTDIAIIQKAIEGDEQAFLKLCELHTQSILYLCAKIMGNYHDGEDAAQEILLLMQRDIVKLKNPDAFRTWLYRLVVRNCCRMKQKLHPADVVSIEDGTDDYTEEHEGFLPENFAESEDNKQILLDTIGQLPDDCRICLLLFYYEGMKYHQIASVMGITTNDVGNLLVKAKKLLRRELESQLDPVDMMPGVAAVGGLTALGNALGAEAATMVPASSVGPFLAKVGLEAAVGGATVAKAAAGGLLPGILKVCGAAAVLAVAVPVAVTITDTSSASAAQPVQLIGGTATGDEVTIWVEGEEGTPVFDSLDNMLGKSSADQLRAFADEGFAQDSELLAFFDEIGMQAQPGGEEATGDAAYSLYAMQKGDNLLMAIVAHQPGEGYSLAFHFTGENEALPGGTQLAQYYAQWAEERHDQA